jgi:hypothetical protein
MAPICSIPVASPASACRWCGISTPTPDNICLNHTSGFARRAAPGMATTLHATVALCQEGGAYVANYGGVEATGPDDPRFVDFIKQMTLNTLLSPPTADSSGLGWHIDP